MKKGKSFGIYIDNEKIGAITEYKTEPEADHIDILLDDYISLLFWAYIYSKIYDS